MKITKDQARAVKELFARQDSDKSYLKFRRKAFRDVCSDAIVMPYCGMLVCIESDGHRHT